VQYEEVDIDEGANPEDDKYDPKVCFYLLFFFVLYIEVYVCTQKGSALTKAPIFYIACRKV